MAALVILIHRRAEAAGTHSRKVPHSRHLMLGEVMQIEAHYMSVCMAQAPLHLMIMAKATVARPTGALEALPPTYKATETCSTVETKATVAPLMVVMATVAPPMEAMATVTLPTGAMATVTLLTEAMDVVAPPTEAKATVAPPTGARPTGARPTGYTASESCLIRAKLARAKSESRWN